MNATRNGELLVERKIMKHLIAIKEILKEAEPESHHVSMAIINNNFSLTCYGENEEDLDHMINFSYHLSDEDPFIYRDKPNGPEIESDIFRNGTADWLYDMLKAFGDKRVRAQRVRPRKDGKFIAIIG